MLPQYCSSCSLSPSFQPLPGGPSQGHLSSTVSCSLLPFPTSACSHLPFPPLPSPGSCSVPPLSPLLQTASCTHKAKASCLPLPSSSGECPFNGVMMPLGSWEVPLGQGNGLLLLLGPQRDVAPSTACSQLTRMLSLSPYLVTLSLETAPSIPAPQ